MLLVEKRMLAWRSRDRSWIPGLVTAMTVVLLAIRPAPLVPAARVYRDVCAQYPMLALLTRHLPPLPSALGLGLAALALLSGGTAGGAKLLGTLRFNRQLRDHARPLPCRLAQLGARLGIHHRLIYLESPRLVACCFGFVRPRIALTAALLDRLDDEEVLAVLAHERHHLRRRDPLRYLALHALAMGVFMLPVAHALRERREAQIELAADQAALAVAPRSALAGAFLAILARPAETWLVGAAGLSATEARIAHLAGTPILPAIPARAALASVALVVVIVAAMVDLAASAQLVTMICRLCSRTI
jgi:Zn-dependent protease with chaperone function